MVSVSGRITRKNRTERGSGGFIINPWRWWPRVMKQTHRRTAPEIAHYRLIATLGEGGMGAVYRATDTKLNIRR